MRRLWTSVALRGKRPYDVSPSRRSGEIGIRTRLKIWRGSLLMSVRVRPPAPSTPRISKTHVITTRYSTRAHRTPVVNVNPTFSAAAIRQPKLRFLPHKQTSLQITQVQLFITIERFQPPPVTRQKKQPPVNHGARKTIEYTTRKRAKAVKRAATLRRSNSPQTDRKSVV